jgi:hypothetical protein
MILRKEPIPRSLDHFIEDAKKRTNNLLLSETILVIDKTVALLNSKGHFGSIRELANNIEIKYDRCYKPTQKKHLREHLESCFNDYIVENCRYYRKKT